MFKSCYEFYASTQEKIKQSIDFLPFPYLESAKMRYKILLAELKMKCCYSRADQNSGLTPIRTRQRNLRHSMRRTPILPGILDVQHNYFFYEMN